MAAESCVGAGENQTRRGKGPLLPGPSAGQGRARDEVRLEGLRQGARCVSCDASRIALGRRTAGVVNLNPSGFQSRLRAPSRSLAGRSHSTVGGLRGCGRLKRGRSQWRSERHSRGWLEEDGSELRWRDRTACSGLSRLGVTTDGSWTGHGGAGLWLLAVGARTSSMSIPRGAGCHSQSPHTLPLQSRPSRPLHSTPLPSPSPSAPLPLLQVPPDMFSNVVVSVPALAPLCRGLRRRTLTEATHNLAVISSSVLFGPRAASRAECCIGFFLFQTSTPSMPQTAGNVNHPSVAPEAEYIPTSSHQDCLK